MLRDVMRGALAGAFATWLMDLVTTGIYEIHPPEVLEQEKAAQPNGKSSVTNLVDRVEAVTGFDIPSERRPAVENAVHYALGVLPGAAYAVLRRYAPASRLGRGLAYGLVLFVVNDELMNASLGLSGPIEAYPPESHLRGFAGHAVLGVATETGIQVLGG
jgi:uncharacterized membrane protein YagU involved in acid resistance